MKQAVKLVVIYLVLQLAASCVLEAADMGAGLLSHGAYVIPTYTKVNLAMLLAMALMVAYLYRCGYLSGDRQLWRWPSLAFLVFALFMGGSAIYLLDCLMERLSFLPDILEQTFSQMESEPLGILNIVVLGPILEELLFRGAATKELLKRYSPAVAILLSALLFGVFHINPAQVVFAFLFGLILAWVYYRTRSLVPCIMLHMLNNGVSTYFTLAFSDSSIHKLVPPQQLQWSILLAAVVFVASTYMVWLLSRRLD